MQALKNYILGFHLSLSSFVFLHISFNLWIPTQMKMSFSKMNNSSVSSHTETNGIVLADDLLMEILTKLPVKCIYRCKCVSRSWRRLIADRYVTAGLPLIFSGMFYRSVLGALKFKPKYGCNCNGSFQETDFSYLPFYHNSSIIYCSNGLLLFYSRILSVFHVCNPTTKIWAALPKPRGKSHHSILAFDAYKSPYYKVVCFSGTQAQGGQLEVFSSETGQWVEHNLNWGVDTNNLSDIMHYFHGVLYVLAFPGHVACIDLEKMCCSVIELPEDIKINVFLGNSGGFLHCAINDGNELRIWVLQGMKWVLKNRVSISRILKWNGDCRDMSYIAFWRHERFNFLAFHPKEDVVFLWVLGKLVSYDLCKNRFGLVCELGTEKERVQVIQICPFL
ncbi:F-box protein At5g49610-like [Dendrobium catenatum]|uniref:F-box protein n=1 Tax=Dendrobium catenatum TaxID=906689 RepID=A0A2I0VHI4_9ASPA|nr:F-box protein At5g49610-like [Dendrobium catenatum]PKU62869.1 F-box protein [Dendrobium catenatum]